MKKYVGNRKEYVENGEKYKGICGKYVECEEI